MPAEQPENADQSDESNNPSRYEEQLVDSSEDGEIYFVTDPLETPDPKVGTFKLIPQKTREPEIFVGTQGGAHKRLGQLNSGRG